jgi:hypothetical protein
MTDSGRSFNMLIPHPDKEKTFQAFTAYNSCACISVRSMILMHKGHGGATLFGMVQLFQKEKTV